MVKILFICHGNICRSPMAMFMMRNLVSQKGLASEFIIDSKATSYEEIGNDLYPKAKKMLSLKNIPFNKHQASRVTKNDYDYYDYLIVMDENNLYNLKSIIKNDSEKKIYKLLDFTSLKRGIRDPWYTDDFLTTYEEIDLGINGLLAHIEAKK